MESKIKPSPCETWQTVVGNDHNCVTPKRLFRSASVVKRPHGESSSFTEREDINKGRK